MVQYGGRSLRFAVSHLTKRINGSSSSTTGIYPYGSTEGNLSHCRKIHLSPLSHLLFFLIPRQKPAKRGLRQSRQRERERSGAYQFQKIAHISLSLPLFYLRHVEDGHKAMKAMYEWRTVLTKSLEETNFALDTARARASGPNSPGK